VVSQPVKKIYWMPDIMRSAHAYRLATNVACSMATYEIYGRIVNSDRMPDISAHVGAHCGYLQNATSFTQVTTAEGARSR
jgi:hypothetical protein